jgi:hypothetical protein
MGGYKLFDAAEEGVLPDAVDFEESKRIKKRASNYCWKEQKLFFKVLLVPKPEERVSLVKRMHEDLGHFGEQRMLAEIRRRYFWHNRTADVKAVIRGCQQCQLVRSSGSIRSGDEQLKSILVCDLFHRVALNTAGSLPETKSGGQVYIFWWPSTTIRSGAKQRRLLTMERRRQLGFWTMR